MEPNYQKKRYSLMKKALWTINALAAAAFIGKAALQYGSLLFSPDVEESRAKTYISELAQQHNFQEPIEVIIEDSLSASADYDHKRKMNVIRIGRPYLYESVFRHEAKHVFDGHVKHDKHGLENFIRWQLHDEWIATLYGIGIIDR